METTLEQKSKSDTDSEPLIECRARWEEGICGKEFPKKDAKYLSPVTYCPECYQRWKESDS